MRLSFTIILGLSLFGGCQSVASPNMVKSATIDMTNAKAVSSLKAALAEAMDQKTIELGPINEEAPSRISVLPPALSPVESKSPVIPTIFELIFIDGKCYAKKLSDGSRYPLESDICQAVNEP